MLNGSRRTPLDEMTPPFALALPSASLAYRSPATFSSILEFTFKTSLIRMNAKFRELKLKLAMKIRPKVAPAIAYWKNEVNKRHRHSRDSHPLT
jgi:hypothetical protein